MTDHAGQNAPEFDNFYDLLVDVIENDPDVSQKSLAGALGQSVNSVSRKLRHEGLVFRLEELPVILGHLRHLARPAGGQPGDPGCDPFGRPLAYQRNYLRLLNYLADLVDCLVIRRPEADSRFPVDREMSALFHQVGELGGRYVEARSPESPAGHGLNRAEKRDLLTLACQVQSLTAGLIVALNMEQEVEDA